MLIVFTKGDTIPMTSHLAAANLDALDPNPVVLDPDDPVDAVLIDMVRLNRSKRADYARDTDPLSNFVESAWSLGIPEFDAVAAVEFNIIQKETRMRALRANGRIHDTTNESVEDSLIDRAVYAVLAVAAYRRNYDR